MDSTVPSQQEASGFEPASQLRPLCACWFPPKNMQIRSTGYCECDSPVMDWQPVQGVSSFHPMSAGISSSFPVTLTSIHKTCLTDIHIEKQSVITIAMATMKVLLEKHLFVCAARQDK